MKCILQQIMKSWLQGNRIELYSTHNEGNCLYKIYKYMTPMSKNVYTDKLDDIVNNNKLFSVTF